MKPRTMAITSMLLDLKAAAFSLLGEKHRNPALLNFYVFIDICASLSNNGEKQNRKIFETYLKEFSVLSKWNRYSPYELWAARSSLLHSYSPFGHHTKENGRGARPIFYYSWPEKSREVEQALKARGYEGFLLLDVAEIKSIAVDTFNELYRRLENEPEFEERFLLNASHILPSLHHLRLEEELTLIDEHTKQKHT